MHEFYLVCAWDNYYPNGGMGNVVLCTFDKEEAFTVADECTERGIPSPYDKEDTYSRYHRDNVVVFSSSDLPWSGK